MGDRNGLWYNFCTVSIEASTIPTIIIYGYKFRFYSSDFLEPPHIHIILDNAVAKIWLEPVHVAHNHGYNQPTLNKLIRLTKEHQSELLEAWNAYVNQI